VGRQDQDLVVGLQDRPHDGAERPGRPGSDQDVGGLGGHAGAPADPLDDGVEQRRQTVGRRVAVHAGMLLDGEVLHAAALGRLQPGVTHVQRVDLALVGRQPVGEKREHRASHPGESRRESRMSRHGESLLEAQENRLGRARDAQR